jgi:hypothetical protein
MRCIIATLLVLAGCSSAPSSKRLARPSSEETTSHPTASQLERKAPLPSAPAPSVTPASRPLGVSFTRVEPAPIVSLAVGKPPKIALLVAGEALVGDGSGSFARVPAPDTKDPESSIEIFFGRDDQPRLMGHRRRGTRVEPYYRRSKGGRFQPEPSELGPLSAPEGALYGVLGHADPEVVCRPSRFCLVKRTTGWRRAPAHAVPVRIVLSSDTAFALHADRIERLEGDAWLPLAPAHVFDRPLSVVLERDGSPWIVEAGSQAIARLVAGRWETLETPVRGPRALAGVPPNDVWLVGASGAAHFDGRAWALVPGVEGPLSLVAIAPPNVWLAGDAGAFRGRAEP